MQRTCPTAIQSRTFYGMSGSESLTAAVPLVSDTNRDRGAFTGAAVPGNAGIGMVAKLEWMVSASSSTNSTNTNNAWIVNPANGNTNNNNNNKNNANYVSCVR
ncbi:MAG: hypothetical protein NTY08_09600 [Proteobacteria bacterium]|nr:hypothetical protein [Pseudomonadota bacterium]